MATLPHTGIAYVSEAEATGEIAELYAEMRRSLQVSALPIADIAMSGSYATVSAYWALFSTFMFNTVLPEPLIAMIFYAIAESNDCRYCSAINETACRVFGIDDATLVALSRDLGNVSPQRVQAIVRFALKACHTPKELARDDFDRLREHGLSDEEIVEVTFLAAFGQMNDILADSFKMEHDAVATDQPGH